MEGKSRSSKSKISLNMGELLELKGAIEKKLFESEENGFTVLTLKVASKEFVTVRGYLHALHEGEHVTLKGGWVTHPKFGRQFEAKECISKLPSSVVGIKKYLGSGLIKGIGPKYAKRLVESFGERTLEVIDSQPESLFKVEGIGKKRIGLIVKAWKDQKEISRVMVFLKEKEISTDFAVKIFKTYGQQSITKMQENPYCLVDDIWGVGFKTADKVALKIGFEKDSPTRIRSGILYLISEATNSGHLYVELEDLKSKVISTLGLDKEAGLKLIKNALHELYGQEKIKLISKDERHYLSLPQFYFSEKGIAGKILKLQSKDSFNYKFNFVSPEGVLLFDQIYKYVREVDSFDIQLNEDQQKGVISCLQSKITIITGGPGTGKTTLIKKLLEILEKHRISFRLSAPTGRAAKRIFEGCGRSAETLHRLLEFSPTTMNFTKNEENVLPVDFLIIDEASMIDVFLMHSILRALREDAHLVLIGDVDQLPSVGAGNVLGDLITSGKVDVVFLKQIFRQAEDSMIIVNAHKINRGEFPSSFSPSLKNDFKFIKEEKPENIFGLLRRIYANLFTKHGISASETIVLCPMNRGIVGTQRLNQELQSILNPAKEKELMRYGQIFRIDDRVMQIKNNYDKFVFNGDIGQIIDIDKVDQVIMVRFGGRVLKYDFAELNELVLSYAVSIHKSQGSEFNAVIVPIFMQHFIMLKRNLIYTAITRAKKLCIFIGQVRAIAMGIKNDKGIERLTFLKEFLTTELEAR